MDIILTPHVFSTPLVKRQTTVLETYQPWMGETLQSFGHAVIERLDGKAFSLAPPETVIALLEEYLPLEMPEPVFIIQPQMERALPRRLKKPRLKRSSPWRHLDPIALAILGEVLTEERALRIALSGLSDFSCLLKSALEAYISRSPSIIAVASSSSWHLLELTRRVEDAFSETFLEVCSEQVAQQKLLSLPAGRVLIQQIAS